MPDLTIDIIRRRAEECGIPSFGELAEFEMRQGMAKFGATNHLSADLNGLIEALDELADAWAYLAIVERRGGRIPDELWTALAITAGMVMVLVDVQDVASAVVMGTGKSQTTGTEG